MAYGPKQKFLARLDDQNDLNDPKIAIKLPRMSFEITSLEYDGSAQLSRFNYIKQRNDSSSTTRVGQITPYIVGMQLNIMAKNQDDALQILEQILPTFQPVYNVSVRFIDNSEDSFDVPITLLSVAMNDDYEGDYNTRRVLVYTLDFNMKIKFFGEPSSSGFITQVITNFNDPDSNRLIETQRVSVNPEGATPENAGIPKIAYSFIPQSSVFILNIATSNTTYEKGEGLYGVTSGYEGIITNVSRDIVNNTTSITIDNATGYFIIGETVVGSQSGATHTLESFIVTG